MVPREKQKMHTRERLLTAAAQCFAEKGYEGCSITDIAQRAHVAQGSMYLHFKNKADLFKVIIEQEHSKGAAKATQAASTTPHLTGILAIMAECVQDVGFPVDHRLWTEILAVAGRDADVREVFAASDKAMRAAFVDLLQKAAHAGEIDSRLDFEATSIWLYALVDGLIARTADNPDFNFENHRNFFESLIRRALCPACV